MDKWKHEIAESSAFFQGYVDQMFSQNKISFKISQIFGDEVRVREVDADRYRRMFASKMNKMIANRKEEGYEAPRIHDSVNDLKIIYPHFTKETDSDQSGVYDIYPRTAVCENCHAYIRLDKPEDFCNCHAKLSQFTFVAFCDECGAHYPIDTMSNLRNDCKKCGLKNGLRRLIWKQKDDLGSYSVKCIRCGHEEKLYLKYCDHVDHQTGAKRSNKKESRFRGVPARAGILTHPLILTFPEVPISGDKTTGQTTNAGAIMFSQSFNYFFADLDFDMQESLLYFPEFWDKLKSSGLFWSKSQIRAFTKVVGLEVETISQWNLSEKFIFIQGLLVEAFNRFGFSVNKETVLDEYGINELHELLKSVKHHSFQEKELQAMSLLLARNDVPLGPDGTIKRNHPISYDVDDGRYPQDLGILEIAYVSNLNVIQALLGVVEGSTRRVPKLYRVIKDELDNKPVVYVRKMQTEGIYFKLSSNRILKWLKSNGIIFSVREDNTENESELRDLVIADSSVQVHLYKLLHTLSHALIQSSSISTGLESQSISEMIFPSEGMILLYSTNSVNVGGLEHTYDYALYEWLSRAEELAMECPQDPACMIDEGGACNACLFIPEFVCESFNEELDRSCLIGGSSRYEKGFFKE